MWLTYLGKHSGEELIRYIDTGKLIPPRTPAMPYNALAMEMTAKILEANYGGKK